MAADLFLLVCALLFGLGFRQLFRHLPEERWQFVASLPLKKNGDGSWQGLNLTFYGLFTGLAGGFGVAGIRAFMTAEDPGAAAASFYRALISEQ